MGEQDSQRQVTETVRGEKLEAATGCFRDPHGMVEASLLVGSGRPGTVPRSLL